MIVIQDTGSNPLSGTNPVICIKSEHIIPTILHGYIDITLTYKQNYFFRAFLNYLGSTWHCVLFLPYCTTYRLYFVYDLYVLCILMFYMPNKSEIK